MGIEIKGENKWTTLLQKARINANGEPRKKAPKPENFQLLGEQTLLHHHLARRRKCIYKTSVQYEKGFNASLFDCIDKALTVSLGKDGVSTFYYAIQERFNIPEKDFPHKPLELLQHLRALIGEAGFAVLETGIENRVKDTFRVNSDSNGLIHTVALAKANYIRDSL